MLLPALLSGVAWAGDEAIVVTGSRLPRDGEGGIAAVRVVDAAAIARSGQDNLADVLRRDPAFAGGFGPGNSNMRNSGQGLNLLDLHGLGTARTLVLVNGRRMVAGLGGASAVDLNMIPIDLVQRVEIATGGGSAIYGSDAVAGVVNIVTDARPDGLTLNAQSGIGDRGDMPRQRIALTAGSDFAEGRGHGWLHGSYAHDGGLLSSARPQSATDYTGVSIFTPQGAFNLDGTIYGIGFDPAKGLVFNDYDGGTLQKGIPLSDGYNRNAFRRIAVPVDRLLVQGGLDYDVGEAVTLHLEGQYGETRSRTVVEPYAAAGGDPARDGVSAIEVPGGIAIDNPYIPAVIAAEIAARNGDANPANDVSFIAFRRRLTDVFERSSRNVRRLWRGVASLSGETGGWRWDASYVFGRTMDRTAADTLLRDRLVFALDAVASGNGVVCRDAAARAAGCQPLNIFGANTASPGAIAYLRGGGGLQTVLESRVEQHVATATLSGTPFRLPAGPARLVVGGEYRHESSFDDWDADTNAGRTLAAQADDVRGGFGVASAFAELALPVLPGVEVQGAGRIDRYSTVGTVAGWRVGGGWTPVRGLSFRVAYALSSRAPSIAELYTSRRETFPGTADPCNGVTGSRTNAFDAACRAIPAIASAIAGGGAFTYSAAEVQAINGFNGGNPSLREETSRSLTAGLTLAPRAVPGLRLTVDYYRISLSNAITTQPRSETVQACLTDPASTACAGLVQRLANGKLSRVDAVLINGGGIRHAGIDLGLDYGLPLSPDMDARVGLRWTHLLEHERQAYPTAPFVDELGQLQDADHARLGSGYRDRFVADVVLRRGAASLSWTARYLGPIRDTKDVVSAPVAAINLVSAVTYHDVQMRVTLPGAAKRELRLGVTNLFDRQPPLLPNGLAASGLLGVETAQEYDSIGRAFYLGVSMRF